MLLTTRALLPSPQPLLFTLFTNMTLAGTIIFGGGPVVIPLLREYIVSEGWVSSRDFLIGLALIQASPGPNFNIAVFLGSLAAKKGGYHPLLGAVLAWVGIFLPGMVLVHGTMGFWGRSLGDDPWWLVVAAGNYVFGRWYRPPPQRGGPQHQEQIRLLSPQSLPHSAWDSVNYSRYGKALLASVANIQLAISDGRQPIHFHASANMKDSVTLLLDADADIESRDPRQGNDPPAARHVRRHGPHRIQRAERIGGEPRSNGRRWSRLQPQCLTSWVF
ncbi:chromate transporter-domain-containing protein [Schizothecium vesticola]|uniref:Chromate transporter-domain-containing protein n=1 Tax=Schizothecium vesticola TaxID=314040 RepID=A0AA40EU98_9PEZI|nr:chromate transporter-domain-containing protein [Schizothecium vesticola]